MVRRRVEIEAIEDNSKRHTTFTKRRQGLFKKTRELCDLCDAEAAVITFSKAGNIFAFGHPSVDTIVKRYLADPSSIAMEDNGVIEDRVHGVGGIIHLDNPTPLQEFPPPLTEAEKRISQVFQNVRPAWDLAVENLDLKELDEFEAAMEKIKRSVVARAEEFAARERGDPNSVTSGFFSST